MISQTTRFVHSNPQGAPAGVTGAPKALTGNENTCYQSNCHGSGTINSGPHTVSINIAGNPDTLTAGQAYSINVKIDNATGPYAGFQLVALSPSRTSIGTLSSASGNKIVSSGGRSYVTHTGRTLKSWTFTWTAPATLPDSVRFYVAGMETVSNVYRTYTTHKTLKKNPVVTAVAGSVSAKSWLVFPNPVQDVLNLKNKSVDQLPLSLEIISMDGKSVLKSESLSASDNQIFLPRDMSPGVYMLRTNFTNGTVNQMIIKE